MMAPKIRYLLLPNVTGIDGEGQAVERPSGYQSGRSLSILAG